MNLLDIHDNYISKDGVADGKEHGLDFKDGDESDNGKHGFFLKE